MKYSDDKNKQAAGVLAAVFFAGIILNFCFVFPVLRHSGKTVFARTDKLNPNTASVGQLAELPSIGTGKAQAIVDYRNEQNTFEKISDLENVRGIGEKTVEKIKQWLVFE